MRNNKAFTLIELLVVISIIALLIGILLPVLGSVREMAIRSKCAQQIRQVLIAQFSYAADHDGQLFSPITPGDPADNPRDYELLAFFIHTPSKDTLSFYLSDLQAVTCPSFVDNTTGAFASDELRGEVNFPRNASYGHASDTWFTGYQWNTVDYVGDADRPDNIDDPISDKTVIADVVVNLSNLTNPTGWPSQLYRGHVNDSLIPEGANVGRLDGSTVWKAMPAWYAVDPLPSTTLADWQDEDSSAYLTPHFHTGDGTTAGASRRPFRPWFH